jgi:hypothetical protein
MFNAFPYNPTEIVHHHLTSPTYLGTVHEESLALSPVLLYYTFILLLLVKSEVKTFYDFRSGELLPRNV